MLLLLVRHTTALSLIIWLLNGDDVMSFKMKAFTFSQLSFWVLRLGSPLGFLDLSQELSKIFISQI